MKSCHIIAVLVMAFGLSVVDAKEQSCLQQLGADKSKQLVNWCINVSPATHPPCNSQNSCALIVSEIKRSCLLLKDTKYEPFYCLLTYPTNP